MPQYFCHQCHRSFDIDASAAVACTRCHGEFVELVNRPAMIAAAMPGGFQALNQLAEMFRNGMERFGAQQPAQPTEGAEAAARAEAGGNAPAAGEPGNAGSALREFMDSMFRPEQRNGDGPQNVTFSFQMPGGVGVQIHTHRAGNGQDGDNDQADLDTTMAEILAQFNGGEGVGAMVQRGFSENEIREYLPMKKVTKEHIDNGAQCTTCFDTFKLGEDVGALDCNHIFHRPCIEPWLKTKNSCPVCRQKVDMHDWKIRHQRQAQEAVLEDLD
ncbi:hypothetical protein L5515_000612 [Caenorhabditis briggsae]|uniref:RING-type E3 ubiquitin transferase n=1 Tax=Caenorhabditis briggsae TaxID=6238 RepID=A0AAE9J1Q1_CAEBR|nr:hypothetical protein L5515_000612 [Caenorhabditis briggsae]